MLSVAVVRSFSEGIALHCVLPGLGITSYLVGRRAKRCMVGCVTVLVGMTTGQAWAAVATGLVDKLAGAALAVRQLDSVTAWDSGVCFAMCFMIIVSCTPGLVCCL